MKDLLPQIIIGLPPIVLALYRKYFKRETLEEQVKRVEKEKREKVKEELLSYVLKQAKKKKL